LVQNVSLVHSGGPGPGRCTSAMHLWERLDLNQQPRTYRPALPALSQDQCAGTGCRTPGHRLLPLRIGALGADATQTLPVRSVLDPDPVLLACCFWGWCMGGSSEHRGEAGTRTQLPVTNRFAYRMSRFRGSPSPRRRTPGVRRDSNPLHLGWPSAGVSPDRSQTG